jgi:hypothetical protein
MSNYKRISEEEHRVLLCRTCMLQNSLHINMPLVHAILLGNLHLHNTLNCHTSRY